MAEPDYYTLFFPILILWGSVILDLIIGDPPNSIHPVRWIGIYIDRMSLAFRRISNGVVSGTLLLITIQISILLVSVLILRLAAFQALALFVLSVVLLKFTFALKSMAAHINPVLEEVSKGDVESARRRLSMMVRRPTVDLDVQHIMSACIETVSEGLVDGFSTTIMAYGLLGIPGAFLVRVANTMDSMIGYRDRLNINFGKASAVFDTLLNYIPARVSAVLILLSGRLLKLHPTATSLRDEARKTESINAGWPMAAMAIALGVRLEKLGSYCLNPEGKEPRSQDALDSMKVYRLAVVILLLIATAEILSLWLFSLI